MIVEGDISNPEMVAYTLSLGLYAMAFSEGVRNRVREAQQGVCHSCQQFVGKLQIHHRVPQCMDGSDDIENAVGLCEDCHHEADWQALKAGVIYPQVYGTEEGSEETGECTS